jgi:Holliday junction resolvase RusA-like endonuclease
MTEIEFFAAGTPAPQGSKRHVGHGIMVESSKGVKPWREAVKWAAIETIAAIPGFAPFTGPVALTVSFYFIRPKSHYRTGKLCDQLRPDAPPYKHTTPDLSKLVRSTEDALTDAGVWRDDALVVSERTTKRFGVTPGAQIVIRLLEVTG